MKDRSELKIEGKLENLSVIGDFISNSMRAFGLDDRKIHGVQMAVDEACTNIIKYGYAHKTGVIHIACWRKGEDIVVVTRDTGKPFDPTAVPPPDLDVGLEEREIGGLGLHFMRSLMDEVRYEFRAGQNVLTMLVKSPSS
jgi:anti-sigma regulatory factor (Ser/Thr protein kinase)